VLVRRCLVLEIDTVVIVVNVDFFHNDSENYTGCGKILEQGVDVRNH